MTLSSATYTLHRGHTPLVISVPHAGRVLTPEVRAALVERAHAVEDTDWHLERLYGFAVALGASFIVPVHSRYVIDLNRPGDNRPMYPGANNTELCPTRFFTGDALYHEGCEPDAIEVAKRRELYWQPYHDALAQELARVKSQHGHAVLFDGHSIKAELPWLFEGRLPDLNLGTVSGESCAPSLRAAVAAAMAAHQEYTQVVDGRFKGGHITRHHGRPHEGVHALQLEMGWHVYTDDQVQPPAWHPERAMRIERVLRAMTQAMIDWRPTT